MKRNKSKLFPSIDEGYEMFLKTQLNKLVNFQIFF
jgi:hypothetical protein